MGKWIAAIMAMAMCGQLQANERLLNQDVLKLGAYQHATVHYVWLPSMGAECKAANPGNPVYSYDEASVGGKAMTALLLAALLNKRKIEVDTSGCTIVEVYLF